MTEPRPRDLDLGLQQKVPPTPSSFLLPWERPAQDSLLPRPGPLLPLRDRPGRGGSAQPPAPAPAPAPARLPPPPGASSLTQPVPSAGMTAASGRPSGSSAAHPPECLPLLLHILGSLRSVRDHDLGPCVLAAWPASSTESPAESRTPGPSNLRPSNMSPGRGCIVGVTGVWGGGSQGIPACPGTSSSHAGSWRQPLNFPATCFAQD